jgi:transketolase
MAVKTKFDLKPGVATREAFGRALVELGKENPNVVAIDADLSKSTMTAYFAKEFPDRFFEVGIAEANLVGIAGGLAAAGKIPFASSFSCFVMNKGFEQLRIACAYPHMNVKIVGTHSGISIGEDGPSQMSVEDLSLACSLPGFVVIAPADEFAMKALVRRAAEHNGPVFLRAGRPKVPIVYGAESNFTIGKAVELLEGNDVTLIAHGLMVAECIRAAEELGSKHQVDARVVDMHTIKPLDREAIARAARETGAIVVAEEHLVDGGLGVRVSQVVAETHPCVMEFVGLTSYAESGSPDALLDKYGMNAPTVVQAARRAISRKR